MCASTGAPPHRVDASTFCSLELHPDRWDAVVLGRPEVVAGPVVVPDLLAAVAEAEERAQRLVDACRVIRAHRDRVQTALLVIDACTDPTTGAVVAAPTTSLPEVRGADRQFDYRYAWLRDASLAAGVAADLGRGDVTAAHVGWLAQRCLACEGDPVPVVRTSGEPVPDEVEVPLGSRMGQRADAGGVEALRQLWIVSQQFFHALLVAGSGRHRDAGGPGRSGQRQRRERGRAV